MKHWEAAGKNDATYEKDVLAPMSVNCCNFPDPRFWITSELPTRELIGPVDSTAVCGIYSLPGTVFRQALGRAAPASIAGAYLVLERHLGLHRGRLSVRGE